MADYCTLDQVRAALPGKTPLHSASDPSDTDANTWITQSGAMVDVALAAGNFVSPAVDTAQMNAIALLCAGEVAFRVMERRVGTDTQQDNTSWGGYHRDFKEALAMMRDSTWAAPPEEIADAGNARLPWSYTMDALTNGDDSMQPRIKKGGTW